MVNYYNMIEKVDGNVFDVVTTPFSIQEEAAMGVEKTKRSTKIICRDRTALKADIIFLFDEGSEEEGVFYGIDDEGKKDLKKVALLKCEVVQVESWRLDKRPAAV